MPASAEMDKFALKEIKKKKLVLLNITFRLLVLIYLKNLLRL